MRETPSGTKSILRVFKTGSALGVGQILTALYQILLPPIFLHSYGIRTYADWLALSSGVTWLTSLDFGLQTFIGNQLSIEYFRGNLDRLRHMQSVALRITAGIVALALAVISTIVLTVPINRVLSLNMARSTAAWIAFLLASQIFIAIVFGQLNGTLRAVGFPHRAESWSQVRSGMNVAFTWGLAFSKQPLWIIAVGQGVAFTIATFLSLADLRRLVPEAFPTLRYWDRATAKLILKPSLWFGSFTLNQFLLFESPILILNQFAGKGAVVMFSLCRTYFGMVRQPLNVIRFSLRPEVTRLVAHHSWDLLNRVYRTFISLNYSTALITAPFALAIAPIIVPIWTKRPDLFDSRQYLAMAFASLMIVAKDCRLDLQHATNQHIRAAALCLSSYGAFALLGIPAAIAGRAALAPTFIALLWATTEFVQIVFVHRENKKLLPDLTSRDFLSLAGAGAIALVTAVYVSTKVAHGRGWSGVGNGMVWLAALLAVLVAASSYMFQLPQTARSLIRKFTSNAATEPSVAVVEGA